MSELIVANQVEADKPKTCGQCRHWHKYPPPKGKLVDLSKPPVGECRQSPPQLLALGGGAGRSVYVGLEAGTLACAQYDDGAPDARDAMLTVAAGLLREMENHVPDAVSERAREWLAKWDARPVGGW